MIILKYLGFLIHTCQLTSDIVQSQVSVWQARTSLAVESGNLEHSSICVVAVWKVGLQPCCE